MIAATKRNAEQPSLVRIAPDETVPLVMGSLGLLLFDCWLIAVLSHAMSLTSAGHDANVGRHESAKRRILRVCRKSRRADSQVRNQARGLGRPIRPLCLVLTVVARQGERRCAEVPVMNPEWRRPDVTEQRTGPGSGLGIHGAAGRRPKNSVVHHASPWSPFVLECRRPHSLFLRTGFF